MRCRPISLRECPDEWRHKAADQVGFSCYQARFSCGILTVLTQKFIILDLVLQIQHGRDDTWHLEDAHEHAQRAEVLFLRASRGAPDRWLPDRAKARRQ